MNASRWARWEPLTGFAFVVLYVAGMLLVRTPDSDDPLEKIAAYYATDKGNRVQTIVAAYILIVAALVFVAFTSSLRARIRSAEDGDERLAAIMFGAGILFAGLLVVGVLALAAVPGGISMGGMAPPDGDVVNTFQSLGWGVILLGAMLAAATMIVAASILVMRTNALPRWTAWLGFAAAIALLFAAIWIPQLALLIWVVAVSGSVIRGRAPAPRPALSA